MTASNPLQPFADAPLPLLTPQALLARAGEAAFQHLGEETVIVLPMTRTLHVLNPTGRFLWDALDQPRRISELSDRVAEAFEVERPRAEADILSWAAELRRQRVLVEPAAGL